MHSAARIKIAAFVLILTAPLLCLAVLGAVPPYGQRSHPKFPSGHALLNGKRGAFDQLGQALLDRSAVTRAAIRLKYTLDYDVSHYVDTDKVVSGRGDWLFYKDDFSKPYVCLDEARMRRDLAQVDVMTDLAAATGLRLFVSISPDKSTIYPEFLHPLARKYWNCKRDAAAMLRRLMAEEAPRIIDHAVPLLAEKALSSTTDLFFHQDTHWSPFGAALALRQLFAAVDPLPGVPVPPPRQTSKTVLRETDMGNLMLLLPMKEASAEIDPAVEAGVFQAYAAHPVPRTVLVHDSFYTIASFNNPAVFPGLQEFRIDKNEHALVPAIATAETLIVNSVERAFLGRIESGPLSWASSLARGLLARNAAMAVHCESFAPAHVEEQGGETTIAVPRGPGGLRPCIRLQLKQAGPANVEIAFPGATAVDGADTFAPGRLVRNTLEPGQQTLALVLPDYVNGRSVRVATDVAGDPSSVFAIEIGCIAPAP